MFTTVGDRMLFLCSITASGRQSIGVVRLLVQGTEGWVLH